MRKCFRLASVLRVKGSEVVSRLRIAVARWGDVALAAALTVFVQVGIWTDDGYLTGNTTFLAVTSLFMTAPLAWRRRFPFGVTVVVSGAIAVQVIVERGAHPPDGPFLAWIVTSYSVAAHADLRRALAGGALLIVAVDLWAYRTGDDLVFIPVILAGFWIAGRVVRSRNLLAAALAERTRELELEREERAKLAVAEERARIARELHDVVSHTLGVIVVQAGAERISSSAGSAHETLESIERSGREALGEMGRLVGMLRADEAEERMPQPGLARLDEVVERVREAGIDVQVVVEGEPRTLAAGVDVSAFRIIQEALTNTVRHSKSSRAQVLLRWEPTALEIQVADDGVGAPAESAPRGGGHGLVGIRERVALFGGVLATGRSDLGGYLLTARLPFSP